MTRPPSVLDGCVALDKPAGMTSHDVVARARRLLGERRIGHAGTLDPDATGVLVLGVGRATRLLRFATGLRKSYVGEVVLGIETDTLDASGQVLVRHDMASVTLGELRAAAAALTGRIEQVPPMVSAIKVGGVRLHELARAGIEIDRPPRTVEVYRFEVTPLSDRPSVGDDAAPGGAVVRIEVDCSSGTYVRSLAADLGRALGGGAHLRNLRRTAVGDFGRDDLVELEGLTPGHLRPALDLVAHLRPATVATEALDAAIRQGKVLDRQMLTLSGPGPWAVCDADGALLGVYEVFRDDKVKPAVVVAGTGPAAPSR